MPICKTLFFSVRTTPPLHDRSDSFDPIFSVWKGHHRGLAASLRLARGVEVQPVTWLKMGKNGGENPEPKKQHHWAVTRSGYIGDVYTCRGWRIIRYIPYSVRGDMIATWLFACFLGMNSEKRAPWLFSLGFLSGMKCYPSYVGIVILIKPWNENPVINQPLWWNIMSGGVVVLLICFFFGLPFSVGFLNDFRGNSIKVGPYQL